MTIHRIWNDLAQDDSGQDLIEYALIAGLIGVIAVASFQTLTTAIASAIAAIAGHLNSIT